jgi:hypothetical protein
VQIRYFLPAHPSYFSDKYTQDEIEKGIQHIDRLHSGDIFKGRALTIKTGGEYKEEFVLLREPGKKVCAVVQSTAQCSSMLEDDKNHIIRLARRSADDELKSIINMLESILERNHGGA